MPRNKPYHREDVLEKAMYLFWENGYETTSVRMLEQKMGINQFSMYADFISKENLFVEALKKYREHVEVHVFSDLLKPGANLKDLERFFMRFLHEIKDKEKMKGCLVVNTTREMGLANDPIAKELLRYYAAVKDMITRVLKNALEAGELEKDADTQRLSVYC